MGYNTTVIVLNDALHQIEKDPEFGKKLAEAIRQSHIARPENRRRVANVSAGNHMNAAAVIETHHADMTTLVAIGGNYGTEIYRAPGHSHHEKKDQWSLLEDALDATTSNKAKPRIEEPVPEDSEVKFLKGLVRAMIDGPPMPDGDFEDWLNSQREREIWTRRLAG